MTTTAPTRRSRRGILCRLGLLAICLPAIAVAALNLWLTSPQARNWLAHKIERKINTKVEVGRASIWPWNGVTLYKVMLAQPAGLQANPAQPLIEIESLRINPLWSDWFRGQKTIQSIELDSPHLHFPIELLAAMAPQAPATLPPLASQQPPTTAPNITPQVAPSILNTLPPATPPPPPRPPAVTLPPVAVPDPSPTVWIHVKNANIELYSIKSKPLILAFSNITGSIPISGKEASSEFTINEIRCAETSIATHIQSHLKWQSPQLSIDPIETTIHGVKCVWLARVHLTHMLPLEIIAQLPNQALPETPITPHASVSASQLAAKGRFIGLALAPPTWQGECIAEALSPSVNLNGKTIPFQFGRAITILRGANLSCIDARLVSDDVSLLGNATILGDGRVAGNARMVATPEHVANATQQLFPNSPFNFPLTQLSTPQRVALDFSATGTIHQVLLTLGQGGPVIEIQP